MDDLLVFDEKLVPIILHTDPLILYGGQIDANIMLLATLKPLARPGGGKVAVLG